MTKRFHLSTHSTGKSNISVPKKTLLSQSQLHLNPIKYIKYRAPFSYTHIGLTNEIYKLATSDQLHWISPQNTNLKSSLKLKMCSRKYQEIIKLLILNPNKNQLDKGCYKQRYGTNSNAFKSQNQLAIFRTLNPIAKSR